MNFRKKKKVMLILGDRKFHEGSIEKMRERKMKR